MTHYASQQILNQILDDAADIARVDSRQFKERIDNSQSPNRVIYGRTYSMGAAQTDAVWQIWAVDVVGFQTEKKFAVKDLVENDGWVHKWSERQSLFAALAFQNDFSLQLSGNSNAYGSVATHAALTPANNAAFSMGFWLKTTNTAAQILAQKASAAAGTAGYTLEIDGSGRPTFELRATGTGDRILVRVDSPSVSLRNGSWHSLVWTKTATTSASGVACYIDGVVQILTILNDTLTGSTSNTAALIIGANQSGASRFIGNMDELAFWNQALTAAEALEIYNSNNGVINLESGSGQIASALVEYWRMADGAFSEFPNIPGEVSGYTLVLQAGVTAGDLETEVPPS